MAIRDDIFPLIKQRDWRACHALLDEAAPGESREERVAIAYWRAIVLQREGRDGEALDLLNSSRGEFFSKCLPDFLRAEILLRLGRPQDAIATLRSAPIFEESSRFPASAH